jgi:hypothetical protein
MSAALEDYFNLAEMAVFLSSSSEGLLLKA